MAIVVCRPELPGEAFGERLDGRVVLSRARRVVDEGVDVRGESVDLGLLVVAGEDRPRGFDGVLPDRLAERLAELLGCGVGGVVDDGSEFVVRRPLAVLERVDDVLGEGVGRRRAFPGDGVDDGRVEVGVFVSGRSRPAHLATEVAVAEAVDDLVGGLLSHSCELLL